MNRVWLRDWPWDTVATINAGLCQQKNALHKPTSDGFEPTRSLWNKTRERNLPLREVLDILRQCHRLAPFCFYNGNTFAAIGRIIIQDLLRSMPAEKAFALRSVVGHYIAGTAGADELARVPDDVL